MRTIAAVFANEDVARRAYERLQDAGIPGDDIGLVLREHAREQGRREEFVRDADQWVGTTAGGALGGVTGFLAGAAAGGAAVAVPVIGPVLAVGALAGVISGGALGWLAGGLASRGMTHEEAAFYQKEVEKGHVLLAVHTDDDNAERVRTILAEHDGREYRVN